jgi:16S rRNA (guanine1516-N2)-methyltransferase
LIRLIHSSDFDPTHLAWWQDCAHLLNPSPEESLAPAREPTDGSPYLRFFADELELVDPRFSGTFSLSGTEVERHAGHGSLLCRATGVVGAELRLLDMFAGFGIDGLALARHAHVTFVEHNPVVFVLLREFADRLGVEANFIHGDGTQHLLELPRKKCEVVYVDPMFPMRNKKALPNRAMQHLQALDTSERMSEVRVADLVEMAQACAGDRVVLKRRVRDPQVGKPNFSMKGRTVRFDVYR